MCISKTGGGGGGGKLEETAVNLSKILRGRAELN